MCSKLIGLKERSTGEWFEMVTSDSGIGKPIPDKNELVPAPRPSEGPTVSPVCRGLIEGSAPRWKAGRHRDAHIYFDTGFFVEDAGLCVARVDTK